MSEHPVLAQALELHRAGFAPIYQKGKQAFQREWNRLKQTPEKLRTEFRPDYNIAVVTGPLSSPRAGKCLIVLDFDIRSNDERHKRDAWAKGLEIAPGLKLTTKTGGDGAHAWFWLPIDRLPKRDKVILAEGARIDAGDGKQKPAWQIECLLSGHACTCPPSVHPSGKPYQWANSGIHVEDAPAPLIEAIERAARASDAAPAGERENWPEPQPLPEVPPVAPFDFRYLPGLLRAFVQDTAERMQCPADFPAVAALVMVGAAIGRRVAIRPRRRTDWLVIPNLWGMLIGKPGIMKSPALGEALAPLKALQAQAFEDYDQARQVFEISERAAKLRAEAREKTARAALKDSPAANVAAILTPDAEPEEPRTKRYLVNDSTVEALAEILEENPSGVLLERDELIGWLRDLEREGRQSDRAFYLTAADGDKGFTVDRIMRGKGRHVEALCVAILGGIQPDVLAEFVRDTQRGAGGDGLLQRFALSVYPDVAPWQNVDRFPDAEARGAVRKLVERLIGLDAAAIGATRDEYRGLSFLPFTEQAQALFDEWFAELEGRLRDDDEHPAMTAHLAKYRKLVPALALIGHLAESEGGPVSEPALARALALAEYLEGHARRVYAVAIRPELDAARSLLAKLRTGKLAIEFRPRDVYRKGWAGLATPDQVSAAVRVLVEFDWLLERHEETGGRPSRVYRADPAAKGRA